MSTPVSLRGVVRSYQRIFRPDRRIYQVEGHRIPIPGGIPLAWLGYASATLLAVLLLGGRSLLLGLLIAAGAGAFALAVGDRRVALMAAVAAFVVAQVLGWLLGALDWPLRLVVVPGLVATLGTQATPDGRPAYRYVRSWLALQLRPPRRWLGRALPVAERRSLNVSVGVAPDHRSPRLRHGRITGPATVVPSRAVTLRVGRWPWSRGQATLTPFRQTPRRRGEQSLDGPLALGAGERLEVRS